MAQQMILDLSWPQSPSDDLPWFYPVPCPKCRSNAIAERNADGMYYIGCKDCLYAIADSDMLVARQCWGSCTPSEEKVAQWRQERYLELKRGQDT